jgi:hypothetical protein
MKAHLRYVSDDRGERTKTIEINTLEEIIEIIKKEEHSVIIGMINDYHRNIRGVKDCDIEIMVYDDHLF